MMGTGNQLAHVMGTGNQLAHVMVTGNQLAQVMGYRKSVSLRDGVQEIS